MTKRAKDSVPPAVPVAGTLGSATLEKRDVCYSEELADLICERLAAGPSLVKICRAPDMPAYRTVMLWLTKYPEFTQLYATAQSLRTDVLAEETLEIADDSSGDVIRDAEGSESVDHDNINRARLKVDTRKWMAAKLSPKKYGDKLLHTGADGQGPIVHALQLNYGLLTDAELMELRRLWVKASVTVIDGDAVDVESEIEAPRDVLLS